MTLNIRPARPADLPVILSLLEGAGLYTSSVTMQAEVTYLLALDDGGQPLGVIGMEHGQGASLLRSFAVRQDARGRGYSRAMLDAAYAVLRGRGDRDIYLFSADEGGYWVHQGYRGSAAAGHRSAPARIAAAAARHPRRLASRGSGLAPLSLGHPEKTRHHESNPKQRPA